MAKDAGNKGASGEIKLYLNQTPGRPNELSILTLQPPIATGIKQILPKTAVQLVPQMLVRGPQNTGVLLASPKPTNAKTNTQIQTPLVQEVSPSISGLYKLPERAEKGLRHFSLKVCEKVQKKGATTYNEVADELVAEYKSTFKNKYIYREECLFEQKNIRRRVYDALNVLLAMKIISKDKRLIEWVGFPTNDLQEVQDLESERQKRLERIKQKQSQLQELILQLVSIQRLIQRNRHCETWNNRRAPADSIIPLPFIVLNTRKDTLIDCSIADDKFEYLFNFNNMYEIHDDVEVMKRMGMMLGLDSGKCTSEQLQVATTLVPKALKPYITEMAKDGIRPLKADFHTDFKHHSPASAIETSPSDMEYEEQGEDEDDEEHEDSCDVSG